MNPHLTRAMTALSNDETVWLFPAYESKLKEAVVALKRYVAELESEKIRMFPRSDNLVEWLKVVASRLGGEVQQLVQAPRFKKPMLTENTAGDKVLEGETMLSPEEAQTPWMEIDNNFYHAQGVLYVVRETFPALLNDFHVIVETKRAGDFGRRITQVLDPYYFTTDPLVVMNCMPLSVCANNSSDLLSAMANARGYVSSFVDTMNN